MSLTLTAAVRANKPKRNVGIIDANSQLSLAIQKNGRAFGWGVNSSGQIGNNSSVNRSTPVSVVGAIKTFCAIAAGSTSSYALDKNGKGWAWGSNSNGRLGDGTLNNSLTPISIYGNKTFCKISGTAHALAIDKNGRAWGWGNNNSGRIGDNSITQRLTPVSILGAIKTFCEISAGGQHSAAIDKNGRAWGWGNNQRGQVGNNSLASQLTPVSVLGAVKTFCIIRAAKGGDHCVAIDKNGRAWGWGYNARGQLGDNSITSRLTPVSVAGAVKTFCKIDAGGNFTLAIDKNGRAWGWGYNGSGQLGDNSVISRSTPVSVVGAVKTFCAIHAGGLHSLAIDKNGRAWGWGNNSVGQLGDNLITSRLTPVSVAGVVKTFCAIIAGYFHSLAIDKNGRAWGWGYNDTGQLGDNSIISRRTPVSILGAVKTFCQISSSEKSSIAIDKNGRAWGWGSNSQGQIGNNAFTSRLTPVSVLGSVKTFCKISSGLAHCLAIDKNNRTWGWGLNNFGQTGDNTTTFNRLTPVSVAGAVKTFCDIKGGGNHSLAIDKNGRAWAWGLNNFGQLGDNSITSRLTPVSVAGVVKTFCAIFAGYNYCLAIDKNGRAWGWGYNHRGQLGDNSITSRLTPVSVAGAVKTFCQINTGNSPGAYHSLAIDKNGRAWGWGDNDSGQLGDNSIISRRTPVSVAGAVKTFCWISAGASYSLAIDKNGRAWGWGNLLNGRLGINKDNKEFTPIQICNI